MPAELRPQMLTPSYTYATRNAVTALGCGLVGAGLMFALAPGRVAEAPALAIHEAVTIQVVVPMVAPVEAPPVEAPPATPLAEIGLVFRVDGSTYMQLASIGGDGEPLPRHGAPHLSEDAYVYASTASVSDADVPHAYRAWQGRQVIVDGTCTATVTGFAVVARLTGDTGYAAVETELWTAASVMDHGARTLAARLDGCTGTYARDAARTPVIVPTAFVDSALASAARTRLLASPAAARAQAEWNEAGMEGAWSEAEDVESTTKLVRHPKTGDTFASVQVRYAGGCGLPDLNLWALYRVAVDGTLTEVPTSRGEIATIDTLIDVEGDGRLEILGRPWLGTGAILSTAGGEQVQSLALPFYGCGC